MLSFIPGQYIQILLKLMIFNFIRLNIILKLMYQSQPQAICENDFYEHLTELIRALKRIIFAVQDVFVLIKMDGDYELNITQIKKIMQQEEQLVQKYDFSLERHKDYQSAYQRFICRLVQNLTPIKIKVTNEEHKIILVQQLLSKLQNCINFHRKEKNLAFMFKRIFVYIMKFCQGCEMLLSCYSQSDAADALKKQVEQQKIEGEKNVIKGVPQQSQSNFQRVIGVLNKRFVTISCLDLDYNCYKSYYFLSRNDTNDELYKDLQTRNAVTAKAISRYSRHFSQYFKRKQKNIIKRNRFRQAKINTKTNDLPNEQDIQHKKKISLQINTQIQVQHKTEDSAIVSLPFLKQQQKRIILQPQQRKDDIRRQQSLKPRRGNFQMKSIYLTINKFHDKFENSNRFMSNYSMTKQQESNRKYSTIKVNQIQLKNTQMVNQSALVQRQRNETYDSPAFEQMYCQSKMAISPRVSIIHKASDRKSQKRNIRITNLTFRGYYHTRINSLLDPENIAFY